MSGESKKVTVTVDERPVEVEAGIPLIEALLGASPRATLFLQRASRAVAAGDGRDYASPDDVKTIFKPVLNHRLIVRPEAQMRGTTAATVLDEVLASVPVPGTRSTG